MVLAVFKNPALPMDGGIISAEKLKVRTGVPAPREYVYSEQEGDGKFHRVKIK